MKPSRKIAVAALIAVVLAMDVIAVLALPAIAGHARRVDPASAYRKAGHIALSTLTSAARRTMVTLAGDGLVAAAKGTSRLYAALHRLAPGAARTRTHCRVLVSGTSGIPAFGIAVVPCREERAAESQPTGPARLFSQSL
jgi:hypothetical protein